MIDAGKTRSLSRGEWWFSRAKTLVWPSRLLWLLLTLYFARWKQSVCPNAPSTWRTEWHIWPVAKRSKRLRRASTCDGRCEKHGNLPIPLKIRNASTKLMKELGYGKGYEKYTKDDLLPEKLKGKKYFKLLDKEKSVLTLMLKMLHS